jgi:hypothetical protein
MVFAGTITTKIDLGRKSKDCKGFGVCSTESTNDLVAAKLVFTPEAQKLKFIFDKDFIVNVSDVIASNCLHEIFIQEEDYLFSKAQSEKLGSTQLIVLPKGTYTIISYNNSWILTIDKVKFLE